MSDFAEFTDGQLDLLPVLDDFNRCQLEVILPTQEQRIHDGALTTGLRNYEEFFQTMVSLAGESQNFDGNGTYVRIQAGGGQCPGPDAARRPRRRPALERQRAAARHAPREGPEAALQAEREVPHASPVPDLSDASIGRRP